MSSLRRHEGYLLIDHTDSPGTKSVPKGVKHEAATITCSHCNRVFQINRLRTRPRHYCAKCDHYVCDNPGCVVGCHPYKKLMDEVQEQGARLLGKG